MSRLRGSAQALLENALGYQFRDPSWLRTALTPPSTGIEPHNQRLEFLGDAILQCCITKFLFRELPHWDEGSLSKLRGLLVCTDSLREWALNLKLVLETGPRSTKKNIANAPRKPLADAMEALIAAVYLDAEQAGLDAFGEVQRLLEKRFLARIREAHIGIWENHDSKTTLQERAASLGLSAPVYELVERAGPDHAPVFTVKAQVGTHVAIAASSTLKRAQTEAARRLLPLLSPGSGKSV